MKVNNKNKNIIKKRLTSAENEKIEKNTKSEDESK